MLWVFIRVALKVEKYMLWVFIRVALKVEKHKLCKFIRIALTRRFYSVQNIMFLWRSADNYSLIIVK